MYIFQEISQKSTFHEYEKKTYRLVWTNLEKLPQTVMRQTDYNRR